MDWLISLVTILGVFIANAALIIPLFLWNRTESRADIRHMDSKLENYMNGIRQEIQAIHAEIKDFHTRLCAIEERNKGK